MEFSTKFRKFSGGGKSLTEERKSRRQKLFDKAKLLLVCVIFAFVWNIAWNTVPATAQVTDNVSSSIRSLLGSKNASINGSYENSTTNAKINYLESQITALEGELQTLQTILESK